MQQLAPPSSLLPPGAKRWATVEDVAIRTKKEVRTIKHWCAQGLFFVEGLAAGYGGLWVAATDDGWPLTNHAGAKAYRERRSVSARVGAVLGAQASVAARKAKKAVRARRSA